MNNDCKPRILFVEDEPLALELMTMSLKQQGFDLKAFSSSTDALEWFRENAGLIDVVVTDQSMPKITGTELALRLREIKPGLPVILVSGMGKFDLCLNESGPVNLIEKPYKKIDLFNAIRAITGGEL